MRSRDVGLYFLEYFGRDRLRNVLSAHLPNNLTVLTCDTFDALTDPWDCILNPCLVSFEVNLLAKRFDHYHGLHKFLNWSTNLPSPCDTGDGMDVTNFTPASHGEFVLAIGVSNHLSHVLVSIIVEGLDWYCLHLQSYRMEEDLI